MVAIVGLSGCGKTTLCHCLSGIIPHLMNGEMKGEVLIDGTPSTELTPPQIATRLGVVFQNPDTQLFFPTVEDELAFGPENLCFPPQRIKHTIDRVLEKVGLEGFHQRNPHELSGGQKQLVALAAVLSLDPDILILDEVTSQLDRQGKERVLRLIGALRDEGRAVVMVEHNPDNLKIADRVKLLSEGSLVDFSGDWSLVI